MALGKQENVGVHISVTIVVDLEKKYIAKQNETFSAMYGLERNNFMIYNYILSCILGRVIEKRIHIATK